MLVFKKSNVIAISAAVMLLYLLLNMTMHSYFRNTLSFSSYHNNADVKKSHKQAKFLHITDLHVGGIPQYNVDYAKQCSFT